MKTLEAGGKTSAGYDAQARWIGAPAGDRSA